MFHAHWKVKLVAFFVLAVWAGGMLTGGAIASEPDTATAVQSEAGAIAERAETAEERALALFNSHDCWRQEAPPDLQGRAPGHVIVTNRRGTTVWGGTRLVTRALGQLFEDEPAGLKIWAFCR